MRIQHNIMAMNAYRNYNTNTSALAKNLEKLSSGYKINRAGDDAAGLAISEKMRAQITGLDAAQKNVKDGISLVKTAEGAMQEVQDMLNRMSYLATQSANGTYDNEVDRANLQKEVDALKSEINRIADSANFNGIKLLDGSLSGVAKAGAVELDQWTDASVGTTAGTNLELVHDGTPAKTPAKGKYEVDLSKASWTASTDSGKVEVNIAGLGNITVTAPGAGKSVSGADIANQFMKEASGTGADKGMLDDKGQVTIDGKKFKVTHDGNGKLTFTGVDTKELAGGQALDVVVTGTDLRLDGTQGGGTGFTQGDITTGGNQAWVQAFTQIEEPVDAANTLAAQAKFQLSNIKDGTTIKIGDETYTFAVGKDSKFKNKEGIVDLTDIAATDADLAKIAAMRLSGAANGNKAVFVEAKNNDDYIYLTEKLGGLDRNTWDVIGKDSKNGKDAKWTNADGDSFLRTGLAEASDLKDANASKGGLALQIGDTSDEFNRLSVIVGDMHTSGMGIDGINIGNPEGAASAIQTIRDAINYVSSTRGDLGAVQNRLEHTANNLSVMAENIQDAESTIRDTDVAKEMMAYTKNNILIQSAQAMLAQANAVPQGVLQLLG